MKLQETPLKRLVFWITEREAIREKKEGGAPPPWTKNSILRSYRFCNVARRDDRVTRWIVDRILHPGAEAPDLWVQVAFARYINWPDTINALMEAALWPFVGTPRWKDIGEFIDNRARIGEKTWTGAYMIRAESNPDAEWYRWGKGRYVAEIVIGGLWKRRRELLPELHASVQRAHVALMAGYGWGSFMAGQVVADLTYVGGWLRNAPDLYTYAPLGPGSRRGLNRLLARPLTAALSQDTACSLMQEIAQRVVRDVPWASAKRLTLHDIQNCLCEFDKFERVRLGTGRPRATYKEKWL